jgi:hypothetical protein
MPPETVRKKCSIEAWIQRIAPEDADTIYGHSENLCAVVHGSATSASAGALGSLTKTIAIVQHL